MWRPWGSRQPIFNKYDRPLEILQEHHPIMGLVQFHELSAPRRPRWCLDAPKKSLLALVSGDDFKIEAVLTSSFVWTSDLVALISLNGFAHFTKCLEYLNKKRINIITDLFIERRAWIFYLPFSTNWTVIPCFTNLNYGFVILIMIYIIRQTTAMNASFGQQSAVNARRLVLKLSLYVLIHVIQFGSGVVEAVWIAIEEPPIGVRYAKVFIGATGGMINGAVYLTVYKN